MVNPHETVFIKSRTPSWTGRMQANRHHWFPQDCEMDGWMHACFDSWIRCVHRFVSRTWPWLPRAGHGEVLLPDRTMTSPHISNPSLFCLHCLSETALNRSKSWWFSFFDEPMELLSKKESLQRIQRRLLRKKTNGWLKWLHFSGTSPFACNCGPAWTMHATH